ncbi:flavodoxin [Pectinatus haikarae]|uniref:flavodoxin n=1 Tax=Pectinatus haikarae TaxID=349096 RepID=UPI0018C45EAB|nr:flavodoxin [Pectinatus haikarae]
MSRKILIVYYSHSSNTRKLAKLISAKTAGMLYELEPERAYPGDYTAVVDQAKKEIEAGYHPPLKTKIKNIADFDSVFVGTPNWWSTMAPPIATFLAEYDLASKTVIPFCTHGGGGSGYIEKNVKLACKKSTVLSMFSSYGSSVKDSDVEAWLKKNGIK